MAWRRDVAALGLAVLVGLATGVSPPVASADPPTRAQVRGLLLGYEDVPGEATWRRLGPGALAHLIALYDDRAEPPFVRLRSIHVAAHYPGPATRTFLEAVARAPGQSDLFIREAILSLARAFGPNAVDAIVPYLDHAEPVVRRAAGIALGRIGTPRAEAAREARRRVEPDRVVRSALIRR